MRILYFGDIMGRSGRDAFTDHVPGLRRQWAVDFVIANAENAAAGFGLTDKVARELYSAGADCLTTGNHVWDQRELLGTIDADPKIIRPLNLPETSPGRGFGLYTLPSGKKILVINVLTQLFMNPVDCPFTAVEKVLRQYPMPGAVAAIFIDVHGEASSEKMAMGHMVDGRASAVIGSHTHIPTADEHLLSRGTAYQTDAGMCGDYDSIIGIKKDIMLHRFTKRTPNEKPVPADGAGTVCGALIEINDQTGLAMSIRRVQIGGVLLETKPILA
jgi:2',3'-cyclic-nucleotide 2'-phosphodiesterase